MLGLSTAWKVCESPLRGCSPSADASLPSPSSAIYAQQTHPTHPTSPSQVVPFRFRGLFCRVQACVCTCTHTHSVHTPLTILYPLSTYLSLFVLICPLARHPCPLTRRTCLIYEHRMPLQPLTDAHAMAVSSQYPTLRSWEAHGYTHAVTCILHPDTQLGRGRARQKARHRCHPGESPGSNRVPPVPK